MKFSDRGIIIGLKKYGENSAIIKIFSQNHGIYRGFAKNIKSAKVRSIFQAGNLISFEYRARLEDNLGQFFSCDLENSYCAKIIFETAKLDCVNSLFSIIDSCFLEHEEHRELYLKLENFLEKISYSNQQKEFISNYIKLELEILNFLGYGIDLSCCVVTNSSVNLAFVSPKSGRAVSLEAGLPYAEKLLKLPQFLLEEIDEFSEEDLANGLKLSGYFLQKFAFANSRINDKEKFNARQKLEQNLAKKITIF